MHRLLVALSVVFSWLALPAAEVPWPKLPERDGPVVIPAQEWPARPGPREVRVQVHYPGCTRASIGPRTGIFLTLHNWGGTDCAGTASPAALAREFNCVALCVNYLQSGPKDSIEGPEPYDFGWLQGLDALRALWLVFHELDTTKTPFARGRLFATGGSGGGNVTLMANKLAPRTFTAVVDMCGMKKLSDALAYNLPAAGGLNARWSRDPASPNFLAPGEQEIRFVGHPAHLAEMKRLGTLAKIFSVHGLDDKTCLADGQEMVANMTRAGLDITPVWVTKEMVDGKVFTTTGHALGNRTLIPGHVAGKFLRADSPDALDRKTPTDFERREDIRYVTTDGAFVISYAQGFPVGRVEPAPATPSYPDRFDVLRVASADGKSTTARTPAEWEPRRRHIAAALERVMGPFPNPAKRVALDVKVLEEVKLEGGLLRRKLTYQSDATDRVAAYLFIPERRLEATGTSARAGDLQPPPKLPAVLCLHQTTKLGKAESAGLVDNPKQYALHLAQRGYVTFAPDYPSFGDSKYDFDPRHGYASGTMKAIWDNVRAVDLLESLPEVDAARLGVIGHSLGGHNAMFTAVFEPRLRVIVSSCGFTTFRKDDLPSWTGKVYMPRIAGEFGNDAARVPFDFPEIVAAFAPRPFLTCSAEGDTDFDVSGVRDVLTAARPVYALHGQAGNLVGYYPKGPHAFPDDARKVAYDFLDRHLRGGQPAASR
jgi:dienelactone hydrolase